MVDLPSAEPQPVRTTRIAAADGRSLRVEVAGAGDRVVVAQLGTPNAGILNDDWIEDAAARGFTLVSYDRPGYGGSTPQPGRTVADCAADLRSISEALGFDRCAVWGFSGGGPHALACGAPSDGLVTAVAVIGSPAPADAPGLDFFAGMREEVQQDIKLFESDPVEWARQGDGQRDAMLAMSAAQLAEAWSASATPADTAVLHGRFGAWLHRAVQFGLTPGNEGWLGDDVALFHSSWGFDPAAISVPVKVWHGREDHFVPFGHGQWLADAIPGAEAELSDADGHMTVMADRISDVHEWLAQYV